MGRFPRVSSFLLLFSYRQGILKVFTRQDLLTIITPAPPAVVLIISKGTVVPAFEFTYSEQPQIAKSYKIAVMSDCSSPVSSPPPSSQLVDPFSPGPGCQETAIADADLDDASSDEQESDSSDPGDDGVFERIREAWDKARKPRRKRYAFKRFLKAYLRAGHGARVRQFKIVLQDENIRQVLKKVGVTVSFNNEPAEDTLPLVLTDIRSEMRKLRQCSFFTDPGPVVDEDIGYEDLTHEVIDEGDANGKAVNDGPSAADWIRDSLDVFWPEFETAAPKLRTLLISLSEHERFNRKSYPAEDEDSGSNIKARILMIIAILFKGFSPRSTRPVTDTLGVYLRKSGVPRRVQDTLARFGISAGYPRTRRLIRAYTLGTSTPTQPSTHLPRRGKLANHDLANPQAPAGPGLVEDGSGVGAVI